jgi:hypothetical protein
MAFLIIMVRWNAIKLYPCHIGSSMMSIFSHA